MTPIEKLKSQLRSIADSIRERTGETDKLTIEQMKAEIEYMPSGDDGETYILIDEHGNEVPAVLTDEEVDLTATANDIREGAIAVTDDGVITGEKEIPSYHTYDGFRGVPEGSLLAIPHANYDYTKFQAIVCAYNTTSANSVAAIIVAINDNVYEVGSTEALSSLSKDDTIRRVNFGINNESDKPCIIRYIMYKEIY